MSDPTQSQGRESVVRGAKTRMMPTEDLQPHPLNARIYGDRADDELMWQIDRLGVINPLLISDARVVISGHRRLDAAKRLGLEVVPTLTAQVEDPLEIEELIIQANKHRQHTNEQLVREYQHLKLIEARRAELRAAKAAQPVPEALTEDAEGAEGEESTEAALAPSPVIVEAGAAVHHMPEGEQAKGETADLRPPTAAEIRKAAAAKVGKGASTLEKGLRVVEVIDQLKASANPEEANNLQSILNNRSVNAAYKEILGEKPEKKAPSRPPLARMRGMVAAIEGWLEAGEHAPEEIRPMFQDAIQAAQKAMEAWEQHLISQKQNRDTEPEAEEA
ncbi:MAG: ParB N-terminal domain-containing protein [Bradymonadia bacterium]